MGCLNSKEAKQEEEPHKHRPKKHDGNHRRRSHHQHHHRSSQKQQESQEDNIVEIHECTSDHRDCRDIGIVSPNILLPDGSFIRVAWAPCGLEIAKEYVREHAAHPEVAEDLNNGGVPEPQQGTARQAQPVSPEAAHMSGRARVPAHDYEYDDGVYDDPYLDDPDAGDLYSGDDIELGPVPPPAAYGSGGGRKGKKVKMVPGPFGSPVPAPGQGGMPLDDPDDLYGGEFYGGADMPLDEEYYMEEGMEYPRGPDVSFGEEHGESSGMAAPATGTSGGKSGSSWAGSTVAPAARPPRARYVANREENLYQEDYGDDPPGVAVAREQRRAPVTSMGYTATSENYNKVRYSRDYRNS